MAGKVLEYSGVGGRDTELSKLHLRRRPGQLQRSPCRVLIVIAAGELEETLPCGGNKCRERSGRGLARAQPDARAECEDWIQYRAGGTRQAGIALHRHGFARRPSPPEKTRSVGVIGHRTDTLLARIDH